MEKEWIFGFADLQEIGQKLAPFVRKSPKVFLSGEMASGKTTLTKAIVKALGSDQEVSSPSFSLVNEFDLPEAPYILRHIDLYRLNNIEESLEIGIEDYLFDPSICIIEWPELIEPIAPENVLRLNLTVLPNNHRKLVFL